jgi:uncharacterized caspase-like protein
MSAHALLIGISRFEDPRLAKLSAPSSDVEAFAKVLQDPSRGGFDSVVTSIDEDLLTIRDRLSTLLDGRAADDMILLYYSGHGIIAKGQRLFLATGQSIFDRPQARSLSAAEMRDMLEQSRAGRLVVILDCCHSGAFADGAKGAPALALNDDTFGSGDGAEGLYVLTATNALQFAYDATGALRDGLVAPVLSRFTGWLVEGLGKGEAAPDAEQITLDELFQYLCKRARAEAAGMTPQRFVKRGSGMLVIARNPTARTAAVAAPLLARLDAADWQTRRDAVAELGRLAKQPRLAALARNAVLDRVSNERDRDVRADMVTLLERLGAIPPEPIATNAMVENKAVTNTVVTNTMATKVDQPDSTRRRQTGAAREHGTLIKWGLSATILVGAACLALFWARVTVPLLPAGLEYREAAARLKSVGLTAKEGSVVSANEGALRSRVFDQAPPAGSGAFRYSEVTIALIRPLLYPLVCRGGGSLAKGLLWTAAGGLVFEKDDVTKAGENLSAGHCSWTDRPMSATEPTEIFVSEDVDVDVDALVNTLKSPAQLVWLCTYYEGPLRHRFVAVTYEPYFTFVDGKYMPRQGIGCGD